MCNENVNEEMVNRLANLIYQFDEETWMKMATRKDLARYIVEKGFCPTTKVAKYQEGVYEILQTLKENYDEEYHIIDETGVKLLRLKIKQLIGEQ